MLLSALSNFKGKLQADAPLPVSACQSERLDELLKHVQCKLQNAPEAAPLLSKHIYISCCMHSTVSKINVHAPVQNMTCAQALRGQSYSFLSTGGSAELHL